MVDDFHSRQSFLGDGLPEVLKNVRIGIVGVSGGGSHVVQQLAHVGFQNYVLFDPDCIELVNLHRHVGACRQDVDAHRAKVEIARRVVRSIWPDASVQAIQSKWQAAVQQLRSVDLLFGCLDGVRARSDLEATARRYLIPLIDIGLGMVGEEKLLTGQVALSMPGEVCLRCMGLLTERDLAREAQHSGNYPGFGPAAQVVWANGVLASTAVGVALDLLTGWNKLSPPHARLQYVGNSCLVDAYPFKSTECEHHSHDEVGDPSWDQ